MAEKELRTLEHDISSLLGEPKSEATVSAPRSPVPLPVTSQKILSADDRTMVRVLRLTYDDIFAEHALVRETHRLQGTKFDEYHIIVPTLTRHPLTSLQLSKNSWAYPTNSRSWLRSYYDAYLTARRELYFAQTFRADVVAVDDPFELGAIGALISFLFKRALHVTFSIDPTTKKFLDADPNNYYRLLIARFIMPRASRVQVPSEVLQRRVVELWPSLEGSVDIIPPSLKVPHGELSLLSNKKNVRKPSFSILIAGTYEQEEPILFALDAVKILLLQYPSVLCKIVANGSGTHSLKKRIAERGLAGRVVTEHLVSTELPDHVASASVVVGISEEGDSDTVRIAAHLGVPILAVRSTITEELIIDGDSGILCNPGDLGCMIKGINRYLGDTGFRSMAGKRVQERLGDTMTSPDIAYDLYRDSLEHAIVTTAMVHEVTEDTGRDT